jgi:hypothetical protein
MAMTVKVVPIANMTSISISEKPLELPGSLMVALLSVLFRIARIISDILTCPYSG